MKTLFIIFMAFLSLLQSNQELPLHQLSNFGDGLNIEGGTIAKDYLKGKQIWANLCVALDCPFQDNVDWNQITEFNQFPLKEASIMSYNEAKVNLAYALVLNYYLTFAHDLANKTADQEVKIIVQVHRNTSGPCHLDLLKRLLHRSNPQLTKIKFKAMGDFKRELFSYKISEKNVELAFCYGNLPEFLGKAGKYENADIVISFSLVAGLNPEWESGSLLIPVKWIPLYLKSMELDLPGSYSVQNHLALVLDDMLSHQDEKQIAIIRNEFDSLNPLKSHPLEKLAAQDFKKATLLQVDGMFNPIDLGSKFYLP